MRLHKQRYRRTGREYRLQEPLTSTLVTHDSPVNAIVGTVQCCECCFHAYGPLVAIRGVTGVTLCGCLSTCTNSPPSGRVRSVSHVHLPSESLSRENVTSTLHAFARSSRVRTKRYSGVVESITAHQYYRRFPPPPLFPGACFSRLNEDPLFILETL